MQFIDLKPQYAALKPSIMRRLEAVLDHGQYILGPEVRELESQLAKYTRSAHCVTVASGTDALLIALMALGVKAGDEVITTPFTFVATAETIVLVGATPVFVDVEPDTCNIDVAKIESMITSRTRAVMPVSLYGQPADMDEINAIAARHGIAVIEDAAQSFGAEYKGHRSGNLSMIGCTSFYPSKPLGCYGDGGALFTNDDALAEAMREIRVHGQRGHYYYERVGVGGRMDSMQCAVVLAKLERFGWELERREAIGARYRELLSDLPAGTCTVTVRPDRSSVYAQFTLISDRRDLLVASLKAAGVPTAIHYPKPLNEQPAYQERCRGEATLVSSSLAKMVFSLPMYADMDATTQERIAHAVRDSLRQAA